MNSDINPDRTKGKQKKSKHLQEKNSDKWTFGRSVLFLFITFDIVVVATWLIYYYSQYEQISKIVGGVWTAVITFLSFMKIKRGRKKSLVEFLQILPVKMVIITYTVIIFMLAGIFVFAEFPIHTVHIEAFFNDKPQSGVSITWDDEKYETGKDGTLIIHFEKAGWHTVNGKLGEYVSETETVDIPWWRLKHNQPLFLDDVIVKPDDPKPKPITPIPPPVIPGSISISSNYKGKVLNGADICIDGEKQSERTPATIKDLSDGEHFIKLIKIEEDYYYEGIKEIKVEAGKTKSADIELKLVGQVCKLVIRSKPPGANIYIDGETHGITPTTVKLPPGTYKIRLEKSSYTSVEKNITVEALKDLITISLSKK